MTRMIYAVGKFFPMQFRIGIPHENMHECPREGEKDGYVEVVDCHGKPMRAPNWEWMYRDIAWHCYIAAQPNGKLKNNKAHAAFLKNYGLEVERLPDLPVAKSWPTEPVSKRDPLVDRYREEVAEQRRLWKEHQEKLDQLRKEAENRSRASEQKYLEEAEARNGITTAATVGKYAPKNAADMSDQMAAFKHVTEPVRSISEAQAKLANAADKFFDGTRTGRMTFLDRKPALQNLPYPKTKTVEAHDAADRWLHVGDFAVFIHPECSHQVVEIVGFGKFEHSDKIGVELAGRRLLYDPKDLVRARMTDEVAGTVSGLTWVDPKSLQEQYIQPGMLVTCPAYPALKMRVTSIEGGLNGDEGKGPRRTPTVCVVIYRGKYVSQVRLSVNDVTPLPSS